MKKYYVEVPDEEYKTIKFIQEEYSGMAFINVKIKNFEPKAVFPWHFSIMIELDNCEDDGLPNSVENLNLLENDLRNQIIGDNENKPNGLFLARIFWNHTCELIWRIYNPEILNEYIQKIIDNGLWKEIFDYRIDNDEDWKLAKWHLSH